MAFIDLIALDKERIKLQLAELSKVRSRFKEFWNNYNQHYSEMKLFYDRFFIFSVRLQYLFIVNNLQPDRANIEVTSKFVEDLGDSVKLREKFLMELIYDAENSIKERISFEEFQKTLQAKRQIEEPPESGNNRESELVIENGSTAKSIGRYPTFKPGVALQLLDLLRAYFVAEDHPKLEKLLIADEVPARPLVFRGFGNQHRCI